MEPLRINPKVADQFCMDRECPWSRELMTQAVTLMPCSHTYDEPSVWKIKGFSALEEPHQCMANVNPECAGEGARVTKVRVVSQINCPECRHPIEGYYRNWALRDVCLSIPSVFKPMEDNEERKIPFVDAIPPIEAAPLGIPPSPPPQVVPRPKIYSFRERFYIAVSSAFGLLGSCIITYASTESVPVTGGIFSGFKVTWDNSNKEKNAMIALFASCMTFACVSVTAYVLKRAQ